MYSLDLKKVAINLYNNYNSLRKVAKLLNIGKSTIHRWINNLSNNKKKINIDNIIAFIHQCINKNKFIKMKDIQRKIHNKFQRKLSLSFIYCIITKKIKYTYKKVNNKFYNKSIKDLHKKQKEFEKKLKTINTNNIICIDETYVHVNVTPAYGWAKIGERLTEYKKCNPIKYSIIVAINNKKVINYDICTKNINTEKYFTFMKKLNELYTNKYFLMDNASFHKSKKIIELFANSTNKILYIPPYSPQYNPIELVFSQIKHYISSSIKKKNISLIKKSFKIVKKSHLQNYYNYSFKTN